MVADCEKIAIKTKMHDLTFSQLSAHETQRVCIEEIEKREREWKNRKKRTNDGNHDDDNDASGSSSNSSKYNEVKYINSNDNGNEDDDWNDDDPNESKEQVHTHTHRQMRPYDCVLIKVCERKKSAAYDRSMYIPSPTKACSFINTVTLICYAIT